LKKSIRSFFVKKNQKTFESLWELKKVFLLLFLQKKKNFFT